MNDDAISAAARAYLLESYTDLKVQLEKGTGTRPMLYLLADARNTAVDAIRKMIDLDASEVQAMCALQNEVRLYSDMMEASRRMLLRGKEADREIDEKHRAEIAEFLTTDEAREMGINQLAEDA